MSSPSPWHLLRAIVHQGIQVISDFSFITTDALVHRIATIQAIRIYRLHMHNKVMIQSRYKIRSFSTVTTSTLGDGIAAVEAIRTHDRFSTIIIMPQCQNRLCGLDIVAASTINLCIAVLCTSRVNNQDLAIIMAQRKDRLPIGVAKHTHMLDIAILSAGRIHGKCGEKREIMGVTPKAYAEQHKKQ